MKNISFAQNCLNDQIRQNRLKIRDKVKLNMPFHQKKDKLDEISTSTSLLPNRTQLHVKVLNRIGLVQKQFIEGSFQDSYELNEKIGEGAHASVYKCIQKASGKVYAVKITKQGDEELIQGSKVQYKILKSLDHRNVMKAQAFYTDKVKMTTYLVCQLCSYQQLGLYLRNQNKKIISEAQATTIITSLLQTLQYLHKKGVCHRDIKPENILYDPQSKRIKVIDFDCAKNKRQSEFAFQMWTKTGSLHYQAPEYFKSTVYNQKVDLWAVGIIGYEMVAGALPFKSNYYQRIVKMITEEEIDIDNLEVSDDFKYLLKKLLERDVSKRYTSSQCLRLPAILKCQQIHSLKMLDDFEIDLSNKAPDSPRSCVDLFQSRSSNSLGCQRESSKNHILKYFCFVAQL